MANNQIVTEQMSVSGAIDFIDSVQNEAAYYVFAAKHTPYSEGSDQTIIAPTDSVKTGVVDIYNDMIFGKKVMPEDVSAMIPRNDWAANTTYVMYDDTSTTLYGNTFYACVNVGSMTHVYKCLYNNADTPSVVEPSGTDINPFETPQDGYIWKYMYSANDSIMRKFSTIDYVPVVVNTSVTEGATPGAIDVVVIEDGGLGYNNYLTDEFSSAADLRIGGSGYLYGLGASASSIDNFYNGCIMKMTSGAAQDEYRIITDFYITGGQKIVVVDEPFHGTIAATDTYEINPYVYVFDTSGAKQTNCIARAIISDTAGNSVSRIEVLEPGSGYRFAQAVIMPDPVVPITSNASLRVVTPPPGGHGADIHGELGANYTSISVKFIEAETPLTVENDYRTVGLLKNPLFSNVNVVTSLADTVGSFTIGEKIFQYNPTVLAGTAAVVANSATVTGTNTFFSDAILAGDRVIITNGSTNMFANVSAVASNTSLTLDVSCVFDSGTASIVLARNCSAYGVLTGVASAEIFITNVSSAGTTLSPYMVGEESYCTSVIDVSLDADQRVSISGRSITDAFNKYIQLSKFVGTLDTGTFVEDEVVTQDSALSYSQPSARFHSLVDAVSGPNDELFVTNVQNVFQLSGSPDSDGVISGTNGARFTVAAKYNGDLVPDSGKILYVENLNPISRSATQSETIKLILEF